MRRRVSTLALLCVVVLLSSAHVGSPDVWYDGMAGPYSVRVLIRPPKVVPGLADIVIRVRGGATRVQVTPAHWDTGPEGAPPPDVAKPLASDPEVFTAQLWLMSRGAYRIIVNVDGARGTGEAIVPVTASATDRLPMSRPLSILLWAGMLFLLFGLISIVGSGVRESLLPPGAVVDVMHRRRARAGMAIALGIGTLILFGGWKWWSAVDRRHRARLDHPWSATASVYATSAGTRALSFAITDSAWLLRTDSQYLQATQGAVSASLIPDHGKLMHLFLIRADDMGAFAHLHPTSHDDVHFEAPMPSLPAGSYRVYGDIVEESGEARTIATSLTVPAGSVDSANAFVSPSDPDDAAWSGGPGADPRVTKLADGSVMRWLSPLTFTAGTETELRVSVQDGAGAPAVLEAYMGMAGHAVVAKRDGSVFVHLHPLGTISTAAQYAVAGRSGAKPAMHSMPMPASASTIVIPYAFPAAGQYRVWVQVKRSGRVLTAAFDVSVT